jgi:DNA-binding NarL/FixJ family response regulator
MTAADKDGLNFIINDLNPDLVIIGAGFYKCATPYMMSMLLREHPDLNIAAVTHSEYPTDLAMWFNFDGVKSYITLLDGAEEFYEGLKCIREGKSYVSASVEERKKQGDYTPPPVKPLTRRQLEVARCLCNGFTSIETGNVMGISESTVNNHKTEMYATLNIRNENEIIRTVLDIGLISYDELIFFGGNFSLNPKPVKQMRNEVLEMRNRRRAM